jgi:hypothetical protein
MAIYYVNTTGNDANGGTDPTTDAKLTLAGALAVSGAGDTIRIVGPGTYSVSSTTTIDDTEGGSNFQSPTIIEGYVVATGLMPTVGSGNQPILTSATNSVAIITTDTGTGTFFVLRGVKITHTAGTRGVGLLGAGANATQATWAIRECEFDGCSIAISDGGRVTLNGMENVTIRNCTTRGFSCSGVTVTGAFVNCRFIDNTGEGMFFTTNASMQQSPTFDRCIFSGNSGAGFSYDCSTRTNQFVRFMNCTFEGNGAAGLNLPVGSTGSINPIIFQCAFYGNGTYGVVVGTKGTYAGIWNRYNAYGSNTSGDHNGWYDGENKITLTANPFTNAASENWTPNAATGGGALLRGVGYGGSDVGAIQSTFVHQVIGGGLVSTN